MFPLLILVGLAVFGLYQIVISALIYFSKPFSHADPERLGQLGDFLGGTLNPIFWICNSVSFVVVQFYAKKALPKKSI
jgi:uncharacterized membrane protein